MPRKRGNGKLVPEAERRRSGRLVGRAAFGLLWLLVAVLALEFHAAWQSLREEHAAARYMLDMSGNPPLMRAATPDEAAPIRSEGLAPAARPHPTPALRPPAPGADQDSDAALRRFLLLNALSDDDRNARATLQGEHWMLYDERGLLECEFGDPFALSRSGEWPVELHEYGPLAALRPGDGYDIRDGTHPMWDRRVERLRFSDPQTGAAKSLFHTRLLNPRPTLDELASAYRNNGDSHVLVPNYINFAGLTGTVVTDQFGFVNYPVQLPKPENEIRIVCIGGSTTHEAEAYIPRTTEYLQQLFEGQFEGASVEIVNCGIAGSASHDLRRHADDYLRYEPDLILYYEGINEIMMLSPKLSLWKHVAQLSAFVVRHTKLGFWQSEAAFEQDWQGVTQRNLLAIRTAAADAGVAMACASFAWVQRDLLSEGEAAFIDINALTTWGAGHLDYASLNLALGWHNSQLRRLCEAQGMGYIPLSEHYHHGMSHFVDLCHNTPVGMQERARILHAWLTPWIEARLAQRGNS